MNIRGNLSKKSIFEIADEITIFSKYLDIPESVIINCIENETLIKSPVRYDDNDASAGFKYNNKGRLKFRDFSGYFWGDCFDVVAYTLNLNVNKKSDFIKILNHVYETITANKGLKVKIASSNRNNLKAINQEKKIITIEAREWNIHDRYYWNDFLYKESDIFNSNNDFNNVYPISKYWINVHSQPEAKYYYKGNNPCYAYFFGYDVNGIANYRLYFPYAKKPFPKFITNNSSWQGLEELENDLDLLILTKSNKDRISIKSFTRNSDIKIGVLAPPSENHIVSLQEYLWLCTNVVKTLKSNGKPAIISLYDFDRTGLNGSGFLKRHFGIPRIMFTDGTYNTRVTGNKDFTATIKMYGKIKFHKLINEYINKIELV